MQTPERWESGLIHQFAKLAYSIRVPGVRIPPSPQSTRNLSESWGFVVFTHTMKACFQEWMGKEQKDYAQHNQVLMLCWSPLKGS